MSEYTTSIYTLESMGFDFGLTDYEIFNEQYREVLNKAILDFYRFHEIGFETPEMFKDRLNARMNLIMRSKYNKLYEAKAIEFNPLYNIEIHENYTRTTDIAMNNETKEDTNNNVTDTATSTNTDTTAQKNLSSSYPSDEMLQNELQNNVYVDGLARASVENTSNGTDNNTSVVKGNSALTSKDVGKNVESFEHTTEGSSAGLPFSKALMQLKQLYDKFELDRQVIDELSDLFMCVW